MSARGRGAVAIDEAEPPDWVHAHVSPDQFKLNRGLLWILLIYKCRGLDQSRYNVAQRLYIHTVGREYKRANPSIRSLMADLECSENTVIEAVKDLEQRGFLLIKRHGNGRNTYILAWPDADTTGPTKEAPALCGAPTKKGGTCTRRAGRGTETPGVGPCTKHGGKPRKPPPAPDPSEAAQEGQTDLFTPQPLRYQEGDDTPPAPLSVRDEDDAHTSTTEASYLNHCGTTPQPLRRDTSTVEAEYVRSALRSSLGSTKSRVLAVGERTVRNARESRSAPPAQPKDHSFASRALIASIPRYRAAPGWVRKHLAAHARAALDRGLGRDAIARYAAMVIAERTFLDHQHIPEFRGAIARLARDVAQSDACPTHGIPECPACVEDRPWTAADQADLEAALARLGITPADHTRLAQGGT